jgi:hypothetical protein
MKWLGQVANVVGTEGQMVFSVFSRLGSCAVFPDRGNDGPIKMAFRVMGFIVSTCLVKDHLNSDDCIRWIVHKMVLLFYVAGLDFGNVSPGGIEPFLIAGGLSDGDVSLIVPCPALRRKKYEG